MSDLVGNPEDRFSHNEAQFVCLFDFPDHQESTAKLPVGEVFIREQTMERYDDRYYGSYEGRRVL